IKAQDLVTNLMKQIEPFHPTFTLGERVDHLTKQDDGSFVLTTSDKTKIHAKVIVIAGGLGCFEPRKPVLEKLEYFEGKGITYMVKDAEKFRNKKAILAGGGDSALDWAVYLSNVAERVTLLHRSETRSVAPESAVKVFDLANNGKIDLILSSDLKQLGGNGHLESVTMVNKSKEEITVDTDYLIPLFGLSPKLGPISDWGLNIDKNAIEVDTVHYSTNVPGIYAIGDINTYENKLKLILCGFHEAALMCQGAFKLVYPEQKLSFKYTTVNGVNAF